MLEQNLKNWQTPTKLKKLDLSGSPKIIVPDDVYNKIAYLCKKESKREWSGVLFYELTSGTIQNPEEMIITLKDILLMDIGSSTYTEFDWDEAVVEYRMNNLQSMKWIVAHVHSHNSMDVFFSSTDDNELNDNATNHNFYLSVIINNYMEMIAKIAYIAQPIRFGAKNEKGEDYTLQIESEAIEPYLLVMDCKLERPGTYEVSDNIFKERYEAVIEGKKKKYEANQKKAVVVGLQNKIKESENSGDYKRNSYNGPARDWEEHNDYKRENYPLTKKKEKDFLEKNKKKDVADMTDAELDMLINSYGNPNENKDATVGNIEDEKTNVVEPEELDEIGQFTCYFLRFGNHFDDDEIIEALSDIEISNMNLDSLIPSIVSNYGIMYDEFFVGQEEYKGDEIFLKTLKQVIDNLEDQSKEYIDVVNPIVEGLNSLGVQYTKMTEENKTMTT